jgi:hypothetical protein
MSTIQRVLAFLEKLKKAVGTGCVPAKKPINVHKENMT